MWNGKMKAVTFSFDDGIVQDKRMIELLDKYNIKATFNLNSGIFEQINIMANHDNFVHQRIKESEVKDLYKNHEVAGHTYSHPRLYEIDDENIIKNEVQKDLDRLSQIVGYEVVGFAYPFCLGPLKKEKEILRNSTSCKYARTTKLSRSFDIPEDYMEFDPTYKFNGPEILKYAQDFVNLKTDKPQLFYVWGHAYELDFNNGFGFDEFEEVLRVLANKDDIFYGTNKEVLLDEELLQIKNK